MEQDTVDTSIWVAETTEDISRFISSLPRLSLDQLSSSDFCPICLVSLSLISSESGDGKPNGITKLKCGHVFCLSDICEWINTPRGSCPTCRDVFLVVPDPSEEESSDGGEYIPGSDLTDDFMEDDYLTEDEEDWIDTEVEIFEGNNLDESSSSPSRDSEQHLEEASAPAHGQILLISDLADTAPSSIPEGLMDELSQLKSNVDSIQPSDLQCNNGQTQEALILSWQKTKHVKRTLASENPTSPDIQSILTTLQQIEDQVQHLISVATADRN